MSAAAPDSRLPTPPAHAPLFLLGAAGLGLAACGFSVAGPVAALPGVLLLALWGASAVPALAGGRLLTWPAILLGSYILYTFQDILIVNLDRFDLPFSSLFKRSDEVVLLLLAAAVVARSLYGRRPLRLHPILLLPLAMSFWSVLCQLVNDVPAKTALLDLFLMVKGWLVLFVALNVGAGRAGLDFFLKITTGLLALVLLVEAIQIPFPGLAQSLFGVEPMLRSGSVRPTGPFEHPGTLGTFLGFAANLLFGAAYCLRSRRLWVFYVAAVVGLVLSLTIRQFMGHLIGVTLFLVLFDRRLLRIGLIAGLALLPLAWPIVEKNAANIRRNYVLYQGDTVRTQAYLAAGRILEQSPVFGVGPGRFGGFVSIQTDSEEYGRQQFDFINQELYSLDAYWPHLFSEYGWPGGLLFLGALAGLFLLFLRESRPGGPPMRRAFGIACLLGLCLSLFDSTFSTFYENTFACLMLFTQWGLLLGSAPAPAANRAATTTTS